jgi:hypothetical protein
MSIRTTVTLDDDVLEKLKQESRSRGIPFRQAINDVLRSGLVATRATRNAPPLRLEPKSMGVRPGLNYDSVPALLELGEGDGYR